MNKILKYYIVKLKKFLLSSSKFLSNLIIQFYAAITQNY